VAATSAGILRDASALPDDRGTGSPSGMAPASRRTGRPASMCCAMIPPPGGHGRSAVAPAGGAGAVGRRPARAGRRFQDGQITALVMPRICRKPTRTLPRRGPCPSGCGMACQAATDAMVTRLQSREDPGDDGRYDAAASLSERNARATRADAWPAGRFAPSFGEWPAPAWGRGPCPLRRDEASGAARP